MVTACIWAVTAASGVFWALRLSGAASSALPAAALTQESQVAVDATAVARALGSGTASAPSSESDAAGTRFTLQGVVWAENGEGAALLSVDGAAAKPYRAGQPVGHGYTLQSINARSITLASTNADALPALILPLPERPPGTPPSIINGAPYPSPPPTPQSPRHAKSVFPSGDAKNDAPPAEAN
ncbi:MAG: hypothetical protein LBP94_07500 [Zoogloeaceae bacterium]|nr:hypothetical protein [Zoogloeaceae bacterium]